MVLKLDNKEVKPQYMVQIRAERNEQDAMILEMLALKNELQTAEAMSHKVSPPTVEELLQQLEEVKRQQSVEKQTLSTELTVTKQELKDLNQQPKREKHLRMKAVEMGGSFMVSEQSPAELKVKLYCEILKLQQMVQVE